MSSFWDRPLLEVYYIEPSENSKRLPGWLIQDESGNLTCGHATLVDAAREWEKYAIEREVYAMKKRAKGGNA